MFGNHEWTSGSWSAWSDVADSVLEAAKRVIYPHTTNIPEEAREAAACFVAAIIHVAGRNTPDGKVTGQFIVKTYPDKDSVLVVTPVGELIVSLKVAYDPTRAEEMRKTFSEQPGFDDLRDSGHDKE